METLRLPQSDELRKDPRTAQQVRSYKPGHAHFLKAKEKIGDRRWLHAAQSNFHDIAPATALGIDTAW